MKINNLFQNLPFISEKVYRTVVIVIGIVLLLTLIYFAKDAYNGILLKLKLCLYIQFFAIIAMQINAILANRINHLKYYAIGGMIFLFATTFYLDNFFFGSLAGNFLRNFIIFSMVQLAFLSYVYENK